MTGEAGPGPARPRVADLIPRFQLRGAETFAQQLAWALRDRYDVAVLPLVGARGEEAWTPPEGTAGPVLPGVAPGRGEALRAAWSLRRRARSFRPHLIVAHGGDPLRVAVLAGLHRLAPIVYVRVAAVPPRLRTPLRARSLAWAYRRAAAFVPVSDSLRAELVDEFGVPAERVRAIRNGRFPPPELGPAERAALRRELGFTDEAAMVLWVGRLVPEKDPLAAVALAGLLSSRSPGARLVMVGDGPLAGRVRATAGADLVTLAGTRADASRLIGAADLLVSTSATEGAPGVLVEALLAGVPAVSFDQGGVRDVLVPGRTGLLVPPGDLPAMADAVAGLVGDPGRRAALGAGARRFGERFHIDRVAEEYDELYREVLAGTFPRGTPAPPGGP